MISKQQIIEAQQVWGQGVVKIGSLKKNRAECELFTSNFLDTLYAFGVGTVLFKPTKCAIQQFRATKAEATSYFIAGKHRACAEDSGFALNPWINVRFENSNMMCDYDLCRSKNDDWPDPKALNLFKPLENSFDSSW